MKGLLYKNFLLTIRQFKYMLIIFAVFFIMGLVPGNKSYWAVYASVMLSLYAGTLLRIDESTKWNQYCGILPLSRKTIVTSYYVGSCGLLLLAVFLYLILSTIIRLLAGGENVTAETALMMFALSFLLTAVTIPLSLKFGSEKAPFIQMLVIAMTVGVGIAVINSGINPIFVIHSMNSTLLVIGIILLVLVLEAISWKISIRIYEKKEIK